MIRSNPIQRAAACLALLLLAALPVRAQTPPETPGIVRVETSTAGFSTRVGPGDLLPVSLKLLNFENQSRVDVTVTYVITDELGNQVYSASDTVAVETTASFVKTIQIPLDVRSGTFIAQSSIAYQGQTFPATAQFPFRVERKIAGIFVSDLKLYGAVTVAASLLAGAVGHAWVRRRRSFRSLPIDYGNVSKEKRVFYELIGDTIGQMRVHVGDRALDIAESVDGLVIDMTNGRVLALKKSPSRAIA
jgi:hypothetical protein